MLSSREFRCVAAVALCFAKAAAANPIIVGVGGEVDTADSRSLSLFTEVGIGDDTWVSAAFGWTDSDREVVDITTKYADIAIDHHFRPLGFRLSAAYWGDDDLLDSNDLRASLYLRGDKGSLALELQRRQFDLTIGAGILLDRVVVEFEADGIGFSGSLPLNERLTVYANAMDYDYSRDIRIQPNVDTLRLFSRSRLSMINSLVDYRASAGLDISFGLKSLDLRIARWRTEVDQGDVDSISLGLLLPASNSADAEVRLAYDDSENFGGATVLSVFFYLFDD